MAATIHRDVVTTAANFAHHSCAEHHNTSHRNKAAAPLACALSFDLQPPLQALGVNEPHAATAAAGLDQPPEPSHVIVAQLADATFPPLSDVSPPLHITPLIMRNALRLITPLSCPFWRLHVVVFQHTGQQADAA